VAALCVLVVGWVWGQPVLMLLSVVAMIVVFVGYGRQMRVDRDHGRDRPWRDRS
jgi:Flp pilus assembly protein TadB